MIDARIQRPGYALVAAAVIALLPALPAVAQIAPAQTGVRIYEEELRTQLDEQVPASRDVGFDAGGWFNFSFFHFDDEGLRRDRTLRLYELRPWGNLNLRGVHQFYVRGLGRYEDWNAGDNPFDGGDDRDCELERAWYQFDLGALRLNQTGQRQPWGLRTRVGRDYTQIGTGFVLSMPLDAVQVEASAGPWRLRGLLGQTVPDTINIDDSPAVEDRQDRCIWGAELAYTGLDHHEPFIYYLANNDHTTPSPRSATQRYDYSSQYVGGGSRGSLAVPSLHYSTELVGEWGSTYGYNTATRQDDIQAWAYDALLEYLFDARTKPRVMAEYIYASGDDDRAFSSTSTIGGNTPFTSDQAFNAFGFRDTGIAFAPEISNLNIYVLGGSFFPLEHVPSFRKFELGSKVFFYQKATGSGPISDPTADNDASWVGWEWDVYANWRLTSDVSWTIRYGTFQPGSAFDEQDCRQFVFTGVTYSF